MENKNPSLNQNDVNILITFVNQTTEKFGVTEGMEVVDDFLSNNKFDRIPTENNLRAIVVSELGIVAAKKTAFFLFDGEYSKEKLYKLALKSNPKFKQKKEMFDNACCSTFDKYGKPQMQGAVSLALEGIYQRFTNDKKDRDLLIKYLGKEDVFNIVSSILDEKQLEDINYDPEKMAGEYSNHIIKTYNLDEEKNKEY